MTHDPGTFVGDPPRTRWHRAWTVAIVTLGALVAAAAFRSSTGDYHWAWVVAAALCFASVAITLSIPRVREGTVVPAASSTPGPRTPIDQ